ncbi:tetraacyldisaccharide 4'-kinase [Zwartia vadi]|uniref:tetraacyldisaccharide 4'-kinase n=1 Tax=Zwartia vadi TaxID=3058168 RepID=UPI0025B31779|nr:tetraacyldisaccharide 4'-kinase [Zwartia vadi]MDN3986346.1 tetraacyldisaccharide 4'-kinase [Zwartia vadi]
MRNPALRARLEHWLHKQWQTRGLWAWLMSPLALLVGIVLCIRLEIHKQLSRWRPKQYEQNKIPVLIVGNIYIGGTGKTPVVIALVNALKARGWHPGVISRGYGVAIGEKPLFGQGHISAQRFGDEPAMIARESDVPICVHPNRRLAYQTLLEHCPQLDLVISDDGLQHLRLPRDIELVVQDARGTGNGWLLPAGPLREPVSRLRTVQAILTRNDNVPNIEKKQSSLLSGGVKKGMVPRHTNVGLEICRFRHLQDGRSIELDSFLSFVRGSRVIAVAGIAMPARFFKGLQKIGLTLAGTVPLPDHFSYDPKTFAGLVADVIVITGKDAVKCENTSDPRVWVAEVNMYFSDPEFLPWLDRQLQIKSARLPIE